MLCWVVFLLRFIQQLHAVHPRQVFSSDWSLDCLKLQFMLCWDVFLLRFIEQLHAVHPRQVFAFSGGDCVHRVRSRHVLGSDWSLKLHFMLCWVVFLLRFIEQLHAVRSRQVLYGIRGNVGLYMLPELPRLCKLVVRQRLGG